MCHRKDDGLTVGHMCHHDVQRYIHYICPKNKVGIFIIFHNSLSFFPVLISFSIFSFLSYILFLPYPLLFFYLFFLRITLAVYFMRKGVKTLCSKQCCSCLPLQPRNSRRKSAKRYRRAIRRVQRSASIRSSLIFFWNCKA